VPIYWKRIRTLWLYEFQGRTYNKSLYLERVARDSQGIINLWPPNSYQRGSLLAQTYVMGSVLQIHTCLLFVLQFSTESWRNERSHPNNEGKLTGDGLWRLHTMQRECHHIQGNVFCLASWCIFSFLIFRKMAPLTGVLLRQVTECRREGAKLGYLHEENIRVRVEIKWNHVQSQR